VFKSFVSNFFIFIIAILIIPSVLHASTFNEDTLPPSSPTNLAFVGYSKTLSWDVPKTNEDGTPLEDLAGYKVYYGIESSKYKVSYDIKNVTTYVVDNLPDWRTYCFVVTAYDTSGNESGYSKEICFKKIPSQYTLSVNKNGTCAGIVTSSPEGINCGSDCDELYYVGTLIILVATPDTGSVFDGWGGGGCSGKGQCVLTINADTTVTATFNTKETKEVKETKEEIKEVTKEESLQPRKPSETIFAVQVGAFRNASYAKTLVTKLYEKGYKAYITNSVTKEGEKLYKVCVGKFSDREKAKTLSEKIRNSEGIETLVTLSCD
jgi:hypothetical protein